MLTKLIIRNFKKFEDVQIPLGDGFAFIGPNNSGKTSALQALALWHAGLLKWKDKSSNSSSNGRRYGITINRKDLVFLPTVHSNALWRNKKVSNKNGKRIRVEITVHGTSSTLGQEGVKMEEWECGLEFDYSNEETFFCRPKRKDDEGDERMPVPEQAHEINVILIPPMSGLADTEPLIQIGRINVLLGQGRTAEVLRNICYLLAEEKKEQWDTLCSYMNDLFGVKMEKPQFNSATGSIELYYKQGSAVFDIQSAGRGMHQVLLLLAFLLYSPRGTVFLLDEPDAHLEILRQEKFYNFIQKCAQEHDSQILAASHSEKVLNEAASNGSAVSFIGKNPRVIGDGKTDKVIKSLNSIGWEKYYEAEQKKWVLFLEGSTDKRILLAFAEKLNHPAKDVLENCFIIYIEQDTLGIKIGEFSALQYAVPALNGLAITDKLQQNSNLPNELGAIWWQKREIENYVFSRNMLVEYAKGYYAGIPSLFSAHHVDIMHEEIETIENARSTLGKPSLFSDDVKISDEITPLLKNFSNRAGLPLLNKGEFYKLVEFIPDSQVDEEIKSKLDKIVQSYRAVPR